jgi:hypothetical protein
VRQRVHSAQGRIQGFGSGSGPAQHHYSGSGGAGGGGGGNPRMMAFGSGSPQPPPSGATSALGSAAGFIGNWMSGGQVCVFVVCG